MDAPNIYTITIVSNIGTPISFTVKRWKIRFFFLVFILFLAFIGYEAYQYLLLREESKGLRKDLTDSQKKIGQLSTQIAVHDNALYHAKEEVEEPPPILETTLTEQPELETKGVWVTDKSSLLTQGPREETALEVTKLNARVKGDDLLLSVQITNTSEQLKKTGGYINIALINNNVSPPVYKSATGGSLGKNGFPSTYKSGKLYSLRSNQRSRTYRRRVQLTETDEYYTDALLLIYSHRGRLLNKQTLPLDKKIFLE